MSWLRPFLLMAELGVTGQLGLALGNRAWAAFVALRLRPTHCTATDLVPLFNSSPVPRHRFLVAIDFDRTLTIAPCRLQQELTLEEFHSGALESLAMWMMAGHHVLVNSQNPNPHIYHFFQNQLQSVIDHDLFSQRFHVEQPRALGSAVDDYIAPGREPLRTDAWGPYGADKQLQLAKVLQGMNPSVDEPCSVLVVDDEPGQLLRALNCNLEGVRLLGVLANRDGDHFDVVSRLLAGGGMFTDVGIQRSGQVLDLTQTPWPPSVKV